MQLRVAVAAGVLREHRDRDLAAVLRHAARCGAKVVITGDHAQLGAVEAGGGMALLARRPGHAQLTETEGMIRSEHGRGYFLTGADNEDAQPVSE